MNQVVEVLERPLDQGWRPRRLAANTCRVDCVDNQDGWLWPRCERRRLRYRTAWILAMISDMMLITKGNGSCRLQGWKDSVSLRGAGSISPIGQSGSVECTDCSKKRGKVGVSAFFRPSHISLCCTAQSLRQSHCHKQPLHTMEKSPPSAAWRTLDSLEQSGKMRI